jgi:hypothetical protein
MQKCITNKNSHYEALRKTLADPAMKLTDGERSQKETELQNQEKRLQRDAIIEAQNGLCLHSYRRALANNAPDVPRPPA